LTTTLTTVTPPTTSTIDEWQKVPEVWDVVRRAVDDDPTGGQFLLAGSASSRHGATAHSGASERIRFGIDPVVRSVTSSIPVNQSVMRNLTEES
jgi:hypothetical protein